VGGHVTYRPLETRSPAARALAGREAVVVKLADDGTGRAMLLFPDLSLLAAVPIEMTEAKTGPV
jgi:hypothetical protein